MMNPPQGTRSSAVPRSSAVLRGAAVLRGLAVLLAMSLLATLVGAALILLAAPAAAAVPGAAPSNPSVPCTWNWNRWSQPGGFTFPYTDSSFDPTQAIFSQSSTALGANGWYEANSAPQFSYSGLAEGVGPREETTGPNDREWSYGVGYYVMDPGSRQSVTISDSGRQESHAFAFYDSAGNQFDRFPKMASVGAGVHYVASEREARSNPTLAGGIGQGEAWSTSVNFTVPADGIVYIHYLNFDERIRTQFATFSGACGPITSNDSSTGNVPGRSVSVNVAANDSRVNPGTVRIVGADATTRELVVPGQGVWSVGPNPGSVTFVPEATFTGDPRPVQYTASDGAGKFARPASVSVAYLPVFSEPDQSLANPTGSTVTLAVTENDSNVNPRTISIVGANSQNGRLIEPERGVWSVDRATGSITFVPDPGVESDPRPISYTVQDVGGNVLPPVSVTVSFAPELVNDESLRNVAGQPVRVDVLGNDPTIDIDPSTINIVGSGPSGVLTITGEGAWSVDPLTNEVVFTPELNFMGDPETITYTVADFDGNVSPAAELLVDYLPVLEDDESLGNPAGGILTIDVLANDPSNDLDATSVTIEHPNYDRTTRSLVVPGEGTWTVDGVTGAITMTPERGLRNEPTPINYTLSDDDGNVATPAQFLIGYNPLPVAEADEALDSDPGAAVTIDVLDNDPTEGIDPLTVRIVGADGSGELAVSGEGDWTIDPTTGEITFTPEPRFDRNPTPIQYTATDELGVAIAPTTVTVTYFGVIPDALAFSEPLEINRWSLVLMGTISAVLFAASAVLTLSGPSRRPLRRSEA